MWSHEPKNSASQNFIFHALFSLNSWWKSIHMPSFQILHSWFTKSFERWDFAANKLTLSCSSCSKCLLRGPKHVTSSSWRMLVICGGNFTIITLSFMAFSVTGNVIWVMWPSKSSNSGLSFTIFIKISNHSVNTSESIHPKFWKQKIIFVNLVTVWFHLVFQHKHDSVWFSFKVWNTVKL